jgi:hypothetical protein
VIAAQEDKIGDLGVIVRRQKDIAGKISDELTEQEPLLTDLQVRVCRRCASSCLGRSSAYGIDLLVCAAVAVVCRPIPLRNVCVVCNWTSIALPNGHYDSLLLQVVILFICAPSASLICVRARVCVCVAETHRAISLKEKATTGGFWACICVLMIIIILLLVL